MNPVFIIEAALVLLLVWMLVYQIVIPLKSGRPIFPMFGRLPKLQDELSRAKQASDEKDLEQQIAKEKANVKTPEGS